MMNFCIIEKEKIMMTEYGNKSASDKSGVRCQQTGTIKKKQGRTLQK